MLTAWRRHGHGQTHARAHDTLAGLARRAALSLRRLTTSWRFSSWSEGRGREFRALQSRVAFFLQTDREKWGKAGRMWLNTGPRALTILSERREGAGEGQALCSAAPFHLRSLPPSGLSCPLPSLAPYGLPVPSLPRPFRAVGSGTP